MAPHVLFKKIQVCINSSASKSCNIACLSANIFVVNTYINFVYVFKWNILSFV